MPLEFDPAFDPATAFLTGGGEMGALMRSHDWAATPLGPPADWPLSLKAVLSACLNSPLLGTVLWGPDLLFLYNDAYIPSLQDRHPAALGRPVSEVWGESWEQVAPPFLLAMETGEGFASENVQIGIIRDGTLKQTIWDFTASAIRGEDGRIVGLLNQGVEITERVRALRALEASEAELLGLNDTLQERIIAIAAERDRLWQVSRDPFVICDLDGRWVDTSPVWEDLLGYSREELIGRTSQWMEHPDDVVKSRAEVREVASGGSTRQFVQRLRSRDGQYRSFSWTAVLDGERFYCVARDVTDEIELAAALRLYRDIVESDTSPVVAWGKDLRLIAFNKAHSEAYLRVYGIEQQVGDSLTEQFVPEQAVILKSFMERALAGERFNVREEFGDPALERPSWDIVYSPLCDASGKIVGAFHHAKDITAEVQAAAELALTQDALRQSQKMEAVGQLTGGLAHDFNNLLTGVMGNLELLQMRVARGRLDDLDRFITAAQGAGRRAAALTQRLLAFSRRQTLDPKPTDVNQLITGLEEMLHRTVGSTAQIEIVGAVGLWAANIDASQLENAIINLCINGRDAMPEGGKLTIQTANEWIDERAGRERDLPPGQYISIAVSDNGTGMSPTTIERAFEPFYTTKPIGQGTGLGLSMIYGFSRQSGGQVRIHSELGQGTTVRLYLPRYHGDAENAGLQDMKALASSTERQTVLVVDDEATIRHLIDEVLDYLGYTVIGAGDGAAGIKVLQSSARIDLLITDVGLPNGMNGRQVADEARRLRPGLRVLFITGFAENAAVGNGHLEPGMELLTKPFTLEALSIKVADILKWSAS
ncbi:PAS domain-containing protein [Sphingomonas sp.]|uniref:PAS domain-containing protein n=1 Tax=Sphingomonas sp. TaxID=28214 RepID=UPI002FDB335D